MIDLPAARGDAVISEAPDAAGILLADFARDHGLALARFAYLLCGDRALADDLVQDCYLGLFRRFGDCMPVESPLAYARRAIVNGYVSSTRRRRAVLTTTGCGAMADHLLTTKTANQRESRIVG